MIGTMALAALGRALLESLPRVASQHLAPLESSEHCRRGVTSLASACRAVVQPSRTSIFRSEEIKRVLGLRHLCSEALTEAPSEAGDFDDLMSFHSDSVIGGPSFCSQ